MKTRYLLSALLFLGLFGCGGGGEVPGVCGDGALDADEVCDDGNTENGDGCRGDCVGEELCGDGLLDQGEECDDGNTQDGDACRSDCTIETCRNGLFDAGE